VATQGVAPAVMPFVVGILAGVVVRGRREWATPAVASQAHVRPLARAA